MAAPATAGKVIHCRAAVAWEAKKPLSIETIEVAPPKAGEVRFKVLFSGVCHSDAHIINGLYPEFEFPTILGHEGSGIVESVGEGVTEFKPGDHVIPLYMPNCGDCKLCRNPKTNHCEKMIGVSPSQGVLLDGTSRFTCKGKTILHFFACSTFSEYTVVPAISLSKINPVAPLEKVCLIGCAISTGYGAAVNTAKVEKGSICAIWGLGAIGLAAVMGCHNAGASRIIAIDINPAKFAIAKQLGATESLNPKDYDKPTEQVLIEMTDGGPDFTFECVGTIATMRSALEASKKGLGVAVVIGLAPADQDVSTRPWNLISGRTWKGSLFGGFKGKDSIPVMVEDYLARKLKVDEFITHTMDLDKINEAFDLMYAGKSIRTVLTVSKK